MSEETPSPKGHAMVMSGGGAFGAYQVGCLQAILEAEAERDYELYAGISVGAIHGALLAQYDHFSQGVEPLTQLWTGITGHDDVWKWTWLGYLQGLFSTGIYNTDPLRHMISANLDVEKLNQSGKSLVVGTSNVLDGKYVEIKKPAGQPLPPDEKDKMVDWLMASTAFPGAFPAVQIKEQLYTDGGVSRAAPITSVIKAGYDSIDVLMTGPKDNVTPVPLDKVKNIPEMLPRLLLTLNLSVWCQDMEMAHLLNLLRKEKGEAPATITVYAPKEPLEYDPLGFTPQEIQAMIEAGKGVEPVSLEDYLAQ